jgi:hypothetical protein
MRKRTVWFLVSMMVLLGCGVNLVANNAAMVQKDQNCTLADGTGAMVFITGGGRTVTTSSGVTTLTCQASGLTPPPDGSAVQFQSDGTSTCNTELGLTTNWQETVSASGQATLTCQINGSGS